MIAVMERVRQNMTYILEPINLHFKDSYFKTDDYGRLPLFSLCLTEI